MILEQLPMCAVCEKEFGGLAQAKEHFTDPATPQECLVPKNALRSLVGGLNPTTVGHLMAKNPNTPRETLTWLTSSCPDLILHSPALPLLALEDPAWVEQLRLRCLKVLFAQKSAVLSMYTNNVSYHRWIAHVEGVLRNWFDGHVHCTEYDQSAKVPTVRIWTLGRVFSVKVTGERLDLLQRVTRAAGEDLTKYQTANDLLTEYLSSECVYNKQCPRHPRLSLGCDCVPYWFFDKDQLLRANLPITPSTAGPSSIREIATHEIDSDGYRFPSALL